MKRGGRVGGDDFSANIWYHSAQFEPTLVFPFAVYFAEAVGAPIYALPHNQFLIEKPRSTYRNFAFQDLVGVYGSQTLRQQMIVTTPGWTKKLPAPLKRILRRLVKR